MESVEESLQALSRTVLRQAGADAKQVLADARTDADAVRKRARQQAETEREQTLERARQEADRIRSQSIAAAQLKARTLKLERREELLNDVFDAARQRLPMIRQWTDYDQIVRLLARESVAQLRAGECLIRADERAREILADDALAELSRESGVHLQLGDTLEERIGVIAETLAGHRQYDNTLQARLQRLQDELRFPVYHLLMGEPL